MWAWQGSKICPIRKPCVELCAELGRVTGEGGLMIHCSKEETEALLAKPGARPFEMRGREMKGWLRVDAESVSTKRALEPWAMQSVAFARALPPKEKK